MQCRTFSSSAWLQITNVICCQLLEGDRVCPVDVMELLGAVTPQMCKYTQHLSHPAATVPARVCCYVLCDVVDLAIYCYPAVVAVLVLRDIRQRPRTAQLTQLQETKQAGRQAGRKAGKQSVTEPHGREEHGMGWAHWLGGGEVTARCGLLLLYQVLKCISWCSTCAVIK